MEKRRWERGAGSIWGWWEPVVNPPSFWRPAKKIKIISGSTIKVAVAVISPHIIPFAEIKPVARIGNVKAFLDVRTRAMISC